MCNKSFAWNTVLRDSRRVETASKAEGVAQCETGGMTAVIMALKGIMLNRDFS